MHVIDYGRAKVTSVYGHGETVYKMLKIRQKWGNRLIPISNPFKKK